jgi:hypothetical protein
VDAGQKSNEIGLAIKPNGRAVIHNMIG